MQVRTFLSICQCRRIFQKCFEVVVIFTPHELLQRRITEQIFDVPCFES